MKLITLCFIALTAFVSTHADAQTDSGHGAMTASNVNSDDYRVSTSTSSSSESYAGPSSAEAMSSTHSPARCMSSSEWSAQGPFSRIVIPVCPNEVWKLSFYGSEKSGIGSTTLEVKSKDECRRMLNLLLETDAIVYGSCIKG